MPRAPPDSPSSALPVIMPIDGGVQFKVGRLHVRDVEEMFVHPAGKADLQRLADRGVGSIATGDIGSLARLLLSIWPFQMGEDATRGILELYELGAPFDLHSGFT